MTTKIELNKELRKIHPKLRMHNGGGSCSFYSNDDHLSGYLASKQSAMVCIFHWSHFSLERWVEEAKELMKGYKNVL